jgi:outer membrane lipoprotein carrier protein
MRHLPFLLLFVCNLSAEVSDFQTLKTSFTQRIVNEENQTLTFRGTLYLKQPNLARYDYDKPLKKTVVIKGDKMLMIEPQLMQATRLVSDISLNILDVWESSKPLANGRRVSVINGREISVEHNAEAIKRVSYIDDFDNFVEIVLSDPRKNEPIGDDFFNLTIPEDYDLIEQ